MRSEEEEFAVPATGAYGNLACALILILIFWLGLMPSAVLAVITHIS